MLNDNLKVSSDSMKKLENSGRIHSLDALRGFDMFWIVGGGAFIVSLAGNNNIQWLDKLALQFQHATWEGFLFYDLIFPLFMFISGAVIPFSILSKAKKGVPKKHLIIKVLRRMLLLIALGIVYNGTLRSGFSEARYVSVLGQIGVAYFFTVVILLFTHSVQGRLTWLTGILVVTAILQLFVPVPGIGAGVITPEGCINGFIDRMLLPGRLAYDAGGMISGHGIYDALGILSTFSSIGITLMGTFAGVVLKSDRHSEFRKTGMLTIAGAVLIISALILHPVYPVVKNCWTSTYTLLAGGISFMLVALFYLLVDIWGGSKYFFFFRIIGMNPLFIYLFYRMVNVWFTSEFLFGWIVVHFGEGAKQPILAFGNILLVWLLLYFLYKKRIFIKI